jgi:UV excision repair protein RAD23
MKVFVKTLKGTNFEIEVKPEDTVIHLPFVALILRFSR